MAVITNADEAICDYLSKSVGSASFKAAKLKES
jgi:hypothetical protein